MARKDLARAADLNWQSRWVLGTVLAAVLAGFSLDCIFLGRLEWLLPVYALGLGTLLALLVWRFRAATISGAVMGGLVTAALHFSSPGWRTALWPLVALLLLTFTATRFGGAQKQKLGLAEGRHGRDAAQVAANLGVAGIAAIVLRIGPVFAGRSVFLAGAMKLALSAALAEAAADTLSSEFGEVLGGEPRLLTTFRPVPTGTDGAISFAGTVAGVAGALFVTAAAAFSLRFSPVQAAIVAAAAIAGLFVDSLLGAVLERRGCLNNDAVNFLSTLVAAALAAVAGAAY